MGAHPHHDTSGDQNTARFTRRRLLGAGAAGAGAAVLGACADDGPNQPTADEIRSMWVAQAPVDDPLATAWQDAPAADIALASQLFAPPFRSAPVVPHLRVRSVHDRRHLAFLLEWHDPEPTESTVRVDAFRDACAVLLGDGGSGDDIRLMGTQRHPVTILHWKADWQHDVDHGVATIDREFPNRSVDTYPPLVTDEPVAVAPADYVDAGATEWLPGLHVGNPLSAPTRSTPVERLTASGFSTTTTAATQDGLGRGVHREGGWSVVIATPRRAEEQPLFAPGRSARCAFAVWSGAHGDSGGRKSPSADTYRLVLRDRVGPARYGT